MKTYQTSELAKKLNIHANTVRFYEKIKFISPVKREKNNYRIFTEKHYFQIKIIKLLYKDGWFGKELRKTANNIIFSMVDWDIDSAIKNVKIHQASLKKELRKAKNTVEILDLWSNDEKKEDNTKTYSYEETSILIGVSKESIRNWERNKLLEIPRKGKNNERYFTEKEIERLKIIYMLRKSKFTISSIFRSMQAYENGLKGKISDELKDDTEEKILIITGDNWVLNLEKAIESVSKVFKIINNIKSNPTLLHHP
ncbi:MAG: MerR family transcriptional regulator [Thermotogota bacterium]